MSDVRPEDLERPQLPPGWEWAELQDLVAPIPNAMTDGPFGSKLKTAHYVGSGVRVLRLSNLGVGEFKDADRSYITFSHYEMLRKHEVFSGDLLIAALADPVGRCCEVPQGIEPAIVKADCIRFVPHAAIERRFVMHWLNSPRGRNNSEKLSHGVGRLRINMRNIRALPVPVAPSDEQRRIVARIEALQERSDAAKEALDAIPPLLEKFRQSVLAAAFRGDLTKKWREQHPDVEPASELLERIRAERRRRWEEANPRKKYKEPEPVDPEGLPALPEGWCWARADELCTSITDGDHQPPPRATSGVPFLVIGDVSRGFLEMSNCRFVGRSYYEQIHQSRKPKCGDILYTVTGSLGIVVPVDTDEPFCVQRHIAILRPAAGINRDFLRLALSSPYTLQQAMNIATGTAQKTVPLRGLRSLALPLAPAAEANVITRVVASALSSAMAVKTLIQKKATLLADFNQSILAKAFRGELVPQDPNDEPASVLLERIRAEREAAAASKPSKRTRRRRKSGGEVGQGALPGIGD